MIMLKNIIITIFKYLFYILLSCILIAFLAKTGNMPAAVPKEYVLQVVEYTDKALIKLKIIQDEKIIQKYYSQAKTQNKKEITKSTRYTINIFEKIYNYIFLNNYEVNILNELNRTVDSINAMSRNQINKLNNLINSSYITTYLQEKELGLNNNNTLSLLYNVLLSLKEIKQVYFIKGKDVVYQYSISDIPPIPYNSFSMDTLVFNKINLIKHDNTFYFLIPFETEKANFIFLLSPDYFFLYFNELNIKNDILIFDASYQVLYTSLKDQNFIKSMMAQIVDKKFNYKNNNYHLKFLALQEMNVYTGIIYPVYPFWKILINFGKLLLILGALFILYHSIKLLYKKLKEMGLKTKPSSLDLITGAMLEVAKSVKSSATLVNHSQGPSPQNTQINPEQMESMMEQVVSKYFQNTSTDIPQKSTTTIKKTKDTTEWKFIEPF